jgi:hypothetical protein
MVLGVSDPQQAALGAALLQANHKFQNIISSPALTSAAAAQEPSIWNGAQIGNTLSDYTGSGWTLFRQNMSKYFPADNGSPESQQVWVQMRLLGSVAAYLAANKTAITSQNIQVALNMNRAWSTGGAIPNVNFHQNVGVPGATRLFSDQAAFQVVKNGVVTGAYGNKYISILSILLNKKIAPGTFG